MTPQKLKAPITAWIAVAVPGYPAYFLGYWRTRKELQTHYARLFTHRLERAGYRAVKVTLTEAK